MPSEIAASAATAQSELQNPKSGMDSAMPAAFAALKQADANGLVRPGAGGRFLQEFLRVASLASADPEPFELALESATRAANEPDQVSPPEPGDTRSDLIIESKKVCSGTKRTTGDPCRAYALRGREFCIYHEDDAVSGLSEIRAAAVRARKAQAHSVLGLDHLPIDLTTRAGLNALMETVLRMELVGKISDSRSRRILRYLRGLQLNIDHLDKEAEADPQRYEGALAKALKAAHVIAARTAAAEAEERAIRLHETADTRRAYLSANRDFGHSQPTPRSGARALDARPREFSPSHPNSRVQFPAFPRR